MTVKSLIRTIPHYPKQGIMFRDITTLLKDANGFSFNDVRRQAGCAGELSDVALPPGAFAAFVELHIEQGPLLEKENIPIGVVERIAAPSTLRIQLTGEGGHAGGVRGAAAGTPT